MSEKIQFVRNYSDISTEQGFQFEFHCDRCGVGYRTEFKRSVTGTVSGILDTASQLFGGFFGQAANVSEQVRSAGWKKARDEALSEAMQQMKGDFIQCPHCSGWVCGKGCWSENKGLCKDCAPDLGVEMSVAQSRRSVEEIHAHAAMAEEDKKLGTENWRQTIRATCPECGAPQATNAKFCGECGAQVKLEKRCSKCNAKLALNAKFCTDCGEKTN